MSMFEQNMESVSSSHASYVRSIPSCGELYPIKICFNQMYGSSIKHT